jgi:hypothetical protein
MSWCHSLLSVARARSCTFGGTVLAMFFSWDTHVRTVQRRSTEAQNSWCSPAKHLAAVNCSNCHFVSYGLQWSSSHYISNIQTWIEYWQFLSLQSLSSKHWLFVWHDFEFDTTFHHTFTTCFNYASFQQTITGNWKLLLDYQNKCRNCPWAFNTFFAI